MKSRFLTLLVAVIMVVACAFPAFAADGINSDEEALLAKFTEAVDSKRDLAGDDLANEYIAEATNALTKVELDKAACDDLSNTIDEAMVILGPVQTRAEAKARSTEVVGLVNKTSEKYGMTVTINGKGGVIGGAEVTIKGDKISDNDGPVNQTGFNMTATYTVAAILVAALLAGIIVVRKNKLAKQ